MKKFRKVGALALAMVSVLASSAAAFAAVTLPASGNTGSLASTDNTLVIGKTINVHGSLATVYGPTVSYTYTIAPASVASGSDVTDTNDIVGVVTAGPAGAVSLANGGTVTFTTAEVSTSTPLAPDSGHELKVNVDPTAFTKPGIYRYIITETTALSALYDAGITRADDYDNTRFLDIYVHNAATTGYEVYGYVLTATNNLHITTATAKSAGFAADDYYTVDVDLAKVVTGAMGDKTHEFPFDIVLTNNGLQYYAAENAAATVNDDKLATNLSFQVNLKNGDTYYLAGLSPRATVTYTENNDTADTYYLTVTSGSTQLSAGNITALTGTKSTGATPLVVSNYDADNTRTGASASVAATVTASNQHVVFTNNLDEISPTGVVLRVTPYAIMLCAGLMILAASRRRNANQMM